MRAGAETAAGDLLTLIASILYVFYTLPAAPGQPRFRLLSFSTWRRGTARPQVVSWASWAALLTESTLAAVIMGDGPSAQYTGLCAAACWTVTILSIRRGDWAITRLDLLSLTGVATGLFLLLTVHSLRAVVAVSCAADFCAYLPTMAHAWHEPDEEPAIVYALYAVGADMTLTAAAWNMGGVTYPLYLAIADTFVFVIIICQRRAHRIPDWRKDAELLRTTRPIKIHNEGSRKKARG